MQSPVGMDTNDTNSQLSMDDKDIKTEELSAPTPQPTFLPAEGAVNAESVPEMPNETIPTKEDMTTTKSEASPVVLAPAPTSVQSSSQSDNETMRSENDTAAADAHSAMVSNSATTTTSSSSPVRDIGGGGTGSNGRGVAKKVHQQEELEQALLPILKKLWEMEPEGLPFRMPVDPEGLQIPVRAASLYCALALNQVKDFTLKILEL